MRGGAIFDRMVEAHQGAPKRILNNVKQQLRQTSGRGASQGKRKSQCRHSEMVSSLVCRRSEMVSSLLCFCTKMKSSEVQCGKRKWEKRPGRLEYVKTYEIWLFHGQQRSWKCIVQTNGSATLYILHSPDQCFPSYTMQDISITYKLVVLQDEPQQFQGADEETVLLIGSPHATCWLS